MWNIDKFVLEINICIGQFYNGHAENMFNKLCNGEVFSLKIFKMNWMTIIKKNQNSSRQISELMKYEEKTCCEH